MACRLTIRVWIRAWSDSPISLVVASTLATEGVASGAASGGEAGCGGGVACGVGATCDGTKDCGATVGGIPTFDPILDLSRGGLSSASLCPLSLIGGSPLPRLPLPPPLGDMVLETKIRSLKSKAYYYAYVL